MSIVAANQQLLNYDKIYTKLNDCHQQFVNNTGVVSYW